MTATNSTCKQCWWFKEYQNQQKGICLHFGHTIKKDEPICANFSRGE